jgi:1-acyl-sn-glycerol-3-phosphate acyltransferase
MENLEIPDNADPSLKILTDQVIGEVLMNFHLSETGVLARLFNLIAYLPAKEFARLIQKTELDVKNSNLHEAAVHILHRFVTRLEIRGYETPPEGPLLVVANHPGGTDPFVMTAAIDRPDLHILSLEHPTLHFLPNISRHLVFLAEDHSDGHLALRKMISLLREGNSLLIYPGGDLETDPDLFPGSRDNLREWSKSIALLLCKLPDVILQPVIIRGTVSQQAWKSWVARLLGRTTFTRLQVAMIYQIAAQQIWRSAFPVQTRLIKGPPLSARQLNSRLEVDSVHEGIIRVLHEILEKDPVNYPLLNEYSF